MHTVMVSRRVMLPLRTRASKANSGGWGGLYLCGSGDCVRGFHFCRPPPCKEKTKQRHEVWQPPASDEYEVTHKGFPLLSFSPRKKKPKHFPDTPPAHISASTGLTSPEAAHVLCATCLYIQGIALKWKHRHWNQNCVSGCCFCLLLTTVTTSPQGGFAWI